MRFSVTTPRCCGSVWAYLEIDWGKSTESRTMTTSMIFTTRKRSHQGGSRTSCLSGPMLMRENWCVWMDGRTDEWVLKLEWVNGWSGPNFIFGKINDGQVVNRWPLKQKYLIFTGEYSVIQEFSLILRLNSCLLQNDRLFVNKHHHFVILPNGAWGM